MLRSSELGIKANAVFVYGTLKRGQCREAMWPRRPTKIREAIVVGSLFGRDDYPAMREGIDRVLGEIWQFEPVDMPAVLKALDRIEGTNQPGAADLYHRVLVEVFDTSGNALGHAHSYRYASDPIADGFVLIEPAAAETYVAWPAGA